MTTQNDVPDPTDPNTLSTVDLRLAYGSEVVVPELNLTFAPGQVTSIVGSNGCGKSTTLRALSRLLKPSGGVALLEGRDISQIPSRELATKLGLLPQHPLIPEGVTVGELVALGRHPHRSAWQRWSSADDAAVERALALTDTTEMVAQRVDALSGGQRQRVWLAMVLAQQTDILLLDEPTSFLDIAHQMQVLSLVRQLSAQLGITVVMVVHDLAMAARFSDHMVAMARGQVVAQGSPAHVVTPEVVRDVFGIDSRVITDPDTGTPVVLPRLTQEEVLTR